MKSLIKRPVLFNNFLPQTLDKNALLSGNLAEVLARLQQGIASQEFTFYLEGVYGMFKASKYQTPCIIFLWYDGGSGFFINF